MIDIACPLDTRISEKEKEKFEIWKEAGFEEGTQCKKIWKCKEVTIVPVYWAFEMPTSVRKWLEVLDIVKELELLQRVCLLETARILRRVLDMG